VPSLKSNASRADSFALSTLPALSIVRMANELASINVFSWGSASSRRFTSASTQRLSEQASPLVQLHCEKSFCRETGSDHDQTVQRAHRPRLRVKCLLQDTAEHRQHGDLPRVQQRLRNQDRDQIEKPIENVGMDESAPTINPSNTAAQAENLSRCSSAYSRKRSSRVIRTASQSSARHVPRLAS
jgi:hypothetical protein